MKAILTALIFLLSPFAFALQYQCEKDINETSKQITRVSTWPKLKVSVASEEIANAQKVCFTAMDSAKDCQIKETSTPDGVGQIQVECAKNIQLKVLVDQNLSGKISCYKKGRLLKSWDVGSCSIP